MAPSILLIWIPIFVSLLFSASLVLVLTKVKFLVRQNAFFFLFLNAITIAPTQFVGSFLGLILSLQINRIFFDYSLLAPILPQGVVIWFADGPAPTRELWPYWKLVKFILWMIFPILLGASSYLRWKKVSRNATICL